MTTLSSVIELGHELDIERLYFGDGAAAAEAKIVDLQPPCVDDSSLGGVLALIQNLLRE